MAGTLTYHSPSSFLVYSGKGTNQRTSFLLTCIYCKMESNNRADPTSTKLGLSLNSLSPKVPAKGGGDPEALGLKPKDDMIPVAGRRERQCGTPRRPQGRRERKGNRHN